MSDNLTEQDIAEMEFQRAGEYLEKMLSGSCRSSCEDYQHRGSIACLDCGNF